MKFINTMAASGRMAMACLLIGVLASCGGGSGSTATPAAKPVLASFVDLISAAGFSWSTAQPATVAISLSRSPAARLGDLTVLVSGYACGASSPNPVRSGLYSSFSLLPVQQIDYAATLGSTGVKLQVPAAATRVLVEVVDNNRGITLYSTLAIPAALATLAIQVPNTPALASCAGAG
jgi:hypothetical protein